MIVTIDGPAGAGKSSVSRRLADEIGFSFLDTGAMYRCVTLACLQQGLELGDQDAVANLAMDLAIDLDGDRVLLDGKDVSMRIRLPDVTNCIKQIADNMRVRQAMVDAQRRWAEERDVVTEGRDQGTVAFPHAECKIFLTATPEERARRRVIQLNENGFAADYDEILATQNLRDQQDMQREVGGLKAATDAITVWTDGLREDQVLARLIEIVRDKQADNETIESAEPCVSRAVD